MIWKIIVGGHVKDNDISFVKENNSIMIGDKNMRNPVLYPPIICLEFTDDIENETTIFKFPEDILLLIKQENYLEQILNTAIFSITDGGSVTSKYSIVNYDDNYFYIQSIGTFPQLKFKVSKQYPYKLVIYAE